MDGQGKNEGVAELIDAVVNEFFNTLAKKEGKLSVADVQRLLDLRKQLAQDELREVRVKWVASNPAPFAINT